jgi:DNA gyrase/topoisomerase IV subunit B
LHKIEVTIHVDGSISVRDNGRGIPVDIHPKWKMPAIELVLTNLHAGGKFGQGAYKYSGGLHGVGAKCTNALSEWFKVEVSRDGKVYHMAFARQNDRQNSRHRRAQKQEDDRHAHHVPARSDDLHHHDRVQVRAIGDALARAGVSESRAGDHAHR